jgi:SSS family solute:Na+ symporter
MPFLDLVVFGLYMLGVLGIGLYHFLRNRDLEDYYVGGRSMGWKHIGMSVVATDVGGGFSIGLGGLGYLMGLAGSWLLFTGLVGAWLAAVLLIPHVKKIDRREGLFTYPDLLRWRYGPVAASLAAVISGIGYLGFTGGQILAGAKLASSTVFRNPVLGADPMTFSLVVIAGITIVYTMVGGMKAVVYTDSAQWLLLLVGLIFVALPLSLHEVGGWSGLRASLPAGHFDILAVEPATFVNWFISIMPIWFVGMTLYQRIYACRSERDARKAWYLAGLLEYPAMAFAGVLLGMCARVVHPGVDPESGLPLLIASILPVGAAGLVAAAYFSAIMSTADSCMMAASGNVVSDVLGRTLLRGAGEKAMLRASMIATGVVGLAAVFLASSFQTVLEIILHAYTFMVAGLFVPTLGVFYWRRGTARAAVGSMLAGGGTALLLIVGDWSLPGGLEAGAFGIAASLVVYLLLSGWKRGAGPAAG